MDTKDDITLKSGKVLNSRYHIIETLNRGGFGITYKAEDTFLGKCVVLKEYAPKFIPLIRDRNGALLLQNYTQKNAFLHGKVRFMEEFATQKKIMCYPNMINVYDCFEENGTAYYVMDYIEGKNLKEMISTFDYHFSREEAVQLIINIGKSLIPIHEKEHLIHRDISADNILISDEGKCYLIDFGSAKQILCGELQEFSVVLKKKYAPIEQYSSEIPQGEYTDVYSLASTLYYLLYNKNVPIATDRINKKIELFENSDTMPEYLRRALSRALEVNYQARTQTVREFLAELEKPKGEIKKGEIANLKTIWTKVNAYIQTFANEYRKEIVVVNGKDIGKKLILYFGRQYSVGRDKQCGLSLSSSEISRIHLLINYDIKEKRYHFHDVSRNGIYTADSYYKNQEFYACEGDIISFPLTDCVIRLGSSKEVNEE